MSENTLIHAFQKNAGEQVRIYFTNYKGKDLLDVRIYYLVDGPEEEWRPSQKGICVRRELMKDLFEGLKLACKQSDEKCKT